MPGMRADEHKHRPIPTHLASSHASDRSTLATDSCSSSSTVWGDKTLNSLSILRRVHFPGLEWPCFHKHCNSFESGPGRAFCKQEVYEAVDWKKITVSWLKMSFQNWSEKELGNLDILCWSWSGLSVYELRIWDWGPGCLLSSPPSVPCPPMRKRNDPPSLQHTLTLQQSLFGDHSWSLLRAGSAFLSQERGIHTHHAPLPGQRRQDLGARQPWAAGSC